jgi:hypothetical protein
MAKLPVSKTGLGGSNPSAPARRNKGEREGATGRAVVEPSREG